MTDTTLTGVATQSSGGFSVTDRLRSISKRKKQEDAERASRVRYIWLTPKKGSDSALNTIRPVWLKSNIFGQDEPLKSVVLHEGIDRLIPGTRRRLFPHMRPGITTVPCLNRNDKDDFCEVCKVLHDVKDARFEAKKLAEQTSLSDDKKAERDWGMYYGSVKPTLYHFFVAINQLGRVDPKEAIKRGKIPVHKNPDAITDKNKFGWTICAPDVAEHLIDPIGVVKWKDWWFDPFIECVNARSMTLQEYEEEVDRSVSQEEYELNCPMKFPDGPFDPVSGFPIQVTVEGRGLEQSWKCQAGNQKQLDNSAKLAMLVAYPNMMEEILPLGFENVISFGAWSKENGADLIAYEQFRLQALADEMYKILGVAKGCGVHYIDQRSQETTMDAGAGGRQRGDSVDTFSLEGAEDLPDVDDIPF